MAKETKQLIAFDLSLTNSGYVVGEVTDGQLTVLELGSIPTTRFTKHSHGFRLNHIAEKLEEIYEKYPNASAIIKEGSFSNGFIRSTQILFKLVGMFELVSYRNDYEGHIDIAPSSIKKKLTGNGRAKKEKVRERVVKYTGLDPSNLDESDAIAVLLSYCYDEGLLDLENMDNAIVKEG